MSTGPKARLDLARQAIDCLAAGDVGGKERGAPAGRVGHRASRILARAQRAAGDGDVGAGFGQRPRDAETETLVAAGNQRAASGECKEVEHSG